MKQVRAPEWKKGLPTRHHEYNKVIRCMIRDNYGHAKRRSRHVLHTAHSVQVEFVSLRTVQRESQRAYTEFATAPWSPSELLVQEAAVPPTHLQGPAILPEHCKSLCREDLLLA
jgi:hypothetical protein